MDDITIVEMLKFSFTCGTEMENLIIVWGKKCSTGHGEFCVVKTEADENSVILTVEYETIRNK